MSNCHVAGLVYFRQIIVITETVSTDILINFGQFVTVQIRMIACDLFCDGKHFKLSYQLPEHDFTYLASSIDEWYELSYDIINNEDVCGTDYCLINYL